MHFIENANLKAHQKILSLMLSKLCLKNIFLANRIESKAHRCLANEFPFNGNKTFVHLMSDHLLKLQQAQFSLASFDRWKIRNCMKDELAVIRTIKRI